MNDPTMPTDPSPAPAPDPTPAPDPAPVPVPTPDPAPAPPPPAPPTIEQLLQAVEAKATCYAAAKVKADTSFTQAQNDQVAANEIHTQLQQTITELIVAARNEDPTP